VSRGNRFDYPYSLLQEAVEAYMEEVFRDGEARNRFLVTIQPLVQRCVGRVVSLYGGALVEQEEDIVNHVNVSMVGSWLPRYLASGRKLERMTGAVKYVGRTIRGMVLNFIRDTYDPRLVPMSPEKVEALSAEAKMDEDDIVGACAQMVEQHVALRPRPDLDLEVVRKVAMFRVTRSYEEHDGSLAG